MGNAAGVGPDSPSHGAGEGSRLGLEGSLPNLLEQLASKYRVSREEVELLRKRFDQLSPDEDDLVSRNVFQKPPYSSDPFCRQIWKRLTGEREAPDKISFSSFVKTMIWWEKAPANMKLELMFSWMKEVDGITVDLMTRVLSHVLSGYTEEELKKMAQQMITVMSSNSSEPSILHQEDFLRWFDQVPEGKLKEALDFSILRLETGTNS